MLDEGVEKCRHRTTVFGMGVKVDNLETLNKG